MNHDATVRAVMLGVLLVVLPIGIYHRLKSQATREPLDRRQEGLFILATLRPIAAVFWVGLIAWIVDPGLMEWSSVSLPVWLRWTGVGVLVTGCGLLVWTFRSLGKNLTDTVVTRQQHTLVVQGPYSWVRHPLYASAALVTMAVSLIAANWFLFVTGVVILCLLRIRTRTEEENLVLRFGDSYRTYMKRTGRFLPRIGANPRPPYLSEDDCWKISGLTNAAAFFRAVPQLLPDATLMCLEGAPAPDVVALLSNHAQQRTDAAPVGTLWSWPQREQRFTLRASPRLYDELSHAAAQHAQPEICSHVHFYRESQPLAQWFDAFVVPFLVAKDAPLSRVKRFCAETGGRLEDPAA